MENEFGCVLDCMDGRTKEAVIKYMKGKYGVRWVDFITEPGINRILADNVAQDVVERIKEKIHISVHKHDAVILAIIAHPDCAGNPVDKETQVRQLNAAKKNVDSFGFDVDIVLLWVEDDWETVEKIDYLAESTRA